MPALVDLFCNDLEVGKSVTLSEVGPSGGYLEHDRPLPVGATLKVHTDEGGELDVVVVRVTETSKDGERPPGMFVRVTELTGETQAWWNKHKANASDPQFPEQARSAGPKKITAAAAGKSPQSTGRTETVDISAEELARMAAEDKTEASAAVPIPGPPPEDASAPNSRRAAPETEDDLTDHSETAKTSTDAPDIKALAAAKDAASQTIKSVNTTVKMTADQVKAITDMAPPKSKRNGTSMGMAVASPPPAVTSGADKVQDKADDKPKKKRRRGRKKKS